MWGGLSLALVGVVLVCLPWAAAADPCRALDHRVLECFGASPSCGWCVNNTVGGVCTNTSAGCYNYSTSLYENQMADDVLSPVDTLLYDFPSNGVAGALLHWRIILVSARKAPMRIPRSDFGYFWDPQQATGTALHELSVTFDCPKDRVQLQVSPLVLDGSAVDIGGFEVYARVRWIGIVNVSVVIDGVMVEGLRVAGTAGDPWPVSLSPDRAPGFLGARFGPEGFDIQIDFDILTNSAGLIGHFACSKVLNATEEGLGLGGDCDWETARRLRINLGSGFLYRPGSVLSFVNGSLIRSLDSLSNGCSNCTSFVVVPPVLPCKLSVVLQGPGVVNNYVSELVLDSFGSFFGPMDATSFNWTLASVDPPNPGSFASISAFLQKQNGSKLVVPLSGGSVVWASDCLYRFRLEVSNSVFSLSQVALHNVTFRDFNLSFAEHAVLPSVRLCDGRSSRETTGEQPLVLCVSAELSPETRDVFVAPSSFPQPIATQVPTGAPAPIVGSFSGSFRRLALSFNWTVDCPFDATFSGQFDVDPAASGTLSWIKTRLTPQLFLPSGVLRKHGETYSFACEICVVAVVAGKYNYSVVTSGTNETRVYDFDYEVPLDNDVGRIFARVDVDLVPPPYRVALEGGGSVPAGSAIVLSAAAVDPISAVGGWAFDWTCSVWRSRLAEEFPCVDQRDGEVLNVSALAGNSTVSFAAGTLEPAPCCLEFEYVFDVRVRKLGDSRGFSDKARAIVYYASPGLQIPSISVSPSVLPSFSPAAPLVLTGHIVGFLESVSYLWEVVEGDLSLTNPESFFLSPSGSKSFALKPNTLMCGRRYVFRLTADVGGLLGFADAVVDVAACPVSMSSSGYLEWSPSPAVAYGTLGLLSARGWIGTAEFGVPEQLLYRFGFYEHYPASLPVGSAGLWGYRSLADEVFLSAFSVHSELETFLPYADDGPAGAVPGERLLRVFVEVCGLQSLACTFSSRDVGGVENATLVVPDHLLAQLQLFRSVGAAQLALATGVVLGEYMKKHWDARMMSAFDNIFGFVLQACTRSNAEFVDYWPSSARLQLLALLLPRVGTAAGLTSVLGALEVQLASPSGGRAFLPDSLGPRGELFEAVLGRICQLVGSTSGSTLESLSNRLDSVVGEFFSGQMAALPCAAVGVVLNSSSFEVSGSKVAGEQLAGAVVSGPRGFALRFPSAVTVDSPCLVVRVVYYASSLNPHGWARFERLRLDSPLVSINVSGSFNSTLGFELVVPYAGSPVSDTLERLCLYWDPILLMYDESVCSVVSYGVDGTTTCICAHLSDYAGFDRATEPPGAYLDDPRGSDFPSVAIVILIALAILMALVLIGCCLCAVSGSSAVAHVVAFVVSFVFRRVKRLVKKPKGGAAAEGDEGKEDENEFVTLSRDVRSAERTVLGSDTMSKEAQRRAKAASSSKKDKARRKKKRELEELESRGTDIESMSDLSHADSSGSSDDDGGSSGAASSSLRGTGTLWKDGPAAAAKSSDGELVA